MNTRMDRSRMNIGVYILQKYARTEKHIREIAECGIDFVLGMDASDPASLDLFAKYGLGAVVNDVGPGWWGGNGENAGKMHLTNTMDQYEAAAASYTDHPAIWSIDVGDEPSALDFPHYGKVIARTDNLFPRQFIYLNLYPNYASVAENTDSEKINQLGTPTYEEYIRRYCQYIPSDYICYDYYLYAAGLPKAYENLRIVSDACLRTGRSMWIVLQVNSNRPDRWITENQLRFQAFSAMAFGAENIIWACYTAGWWHNQVLDKNGEKTEQYEKLKKVNAEIHTIADKYMKFRRTDTHFVGFADRRDLSAWGGSDPLESLNTGVFFDVQAANGNNLVIGEMSSRSGDGSRALMICAADDPMDEQPKEVEIRFRAPGRQICAYGGSGKLPVHSLSDSIYSITVRSSDGVLITAR